VEGLEVAHDDDRLVPAEYDLSEVPDINHEILDDNTRLDVPNNNGSDGIVGYGVSKDADMGKKPMEWFSLLFIATSK